MAPEQTLAEPVPHRRRCTGQGAHKRSCTGRASGTWKVHRPASPSLAFVEGSGWDSVDVGKLGKLLPGRNQQVVTSTGPFPVRGLLAQPSFHGIVVEVVKSDQLKRRLLQGGIHTTRQPTSPVGIRQQRHPPITRKGQLVEVTRLVKMPDLFTMGLIYGHVDDCTKSMTAENENVCHRLCQC